MTEPNISMRQLIEGLGAQMAEALTVSVTRAPSDRTPFRGVVVLGMGGSGIGGAVLADMVRATSPMPVQAVSDQVLPGWVNADCLVVASSYSGNTEETLAALNEAERRGCTLAAVTSGGTLGACRRRRLARGEDARRQPPAFSVWPFLPGPVCAVARL